MNKISKGKRTTQESDFYAAEKRKLWLINLIEREEKRKEDGTV